MSKSQLDDFLEIYNRAYATIDGAIDGFIGTLKASHSESPNGGTFFICIENALMQHAARLALFRQSCLGHTVTEAMFGDLARETFRRTQGRRTQGRRRCGASNARPSWARLTRTGNGAGHD
jgi:hypothetical protein